MPTPCPKRRPRAVPLLALVAATACSSAPPEPVPGHSHRTTATVTVTDDALLPGPRVEIPAFSSVVWRNRGTQPLEVSIAAATCGGCDTVLGFRPTASGSRCNAIAPGSVATICFHAAGTFPFTTRLGATERTGEIVVGGGK